MIPLGMFRNGVWVAEYVQDSLYYLCISGKVLSICYKFRGIYVSEGASCK